MPPQTSVTQHPMKPIVDAWISKIDAAKKVRDEKFGKYAMEAEKFYNGPTNWMWTDEVARGVGGFLDRDSSAAMPMFRLEVNKPAEAVALFGPALFFKYPDVVIEPIEHPVPTPELLGLHPEDPYGMAYYQQFAAQEQMGFQAKAYHAEIKQDYANWVQYEGQKKVQARRAITEALTAGLGLLETKWHTPPDSKISYPKSFYKSWKHYYKDPDAEYHEDVLWVALETTATVSHWEKKFNLKPGSLKGFLQSIESQSTQRGRKEAKQGHIGGQSFDLLTVFEVYSKNGFGDRLKGTNGKTVRTKLDFSPLGDFCYLAVAKGVPYPLNVPTEMLQNDPEAVFEAAQWPIPFCGDSAWPVSELGFLDENRSVWPIPLIKPVIGPMRFVNWVMSFLADKTAASCTTYIGMLKKAGAEIQRSVQGGASPYGIIDIANDMGKTVSDLISFLQAPDFPQHIWTMVSEAMDMIDKGTGLTELIYGMSSTQIRSAEEARIKSGNVSIRPDEMASKTEDWLAETCSKEIQALVYLAEEQDVIPVLGEMNGRIFMEQIATKDLDVIMRDFHFRVAAGSARKPNKSAKAAALNEFAQVAMQPFVELAGMGQIGPLSALLQDIAEANDLDAERYAIQMPEQGPDPEQQKMEMEMQLAQQKADMERDKAGMEMQMKAAELQFKAEEHQQDLAFEHEKHEMTMAHEQQKMSQEISLSRRKAQADQQVMRAKADSQIRVTKAVGDAKIKQAKQQAKAKPKPKSGSKK